MEPFRAPRPLLHIAPRPPGTLEARLEDAAADARAGFMPAFLEQCFGALSGVAYSLQQLCANDITPLAHHLEALAHQIRVVSEALYDSIRTCLALQRTGELAADAFQAALVQMHACLHALGGVSYSLQLLSRQDALAMAPYLAALADQVEVITAELDRRIHFSFTDTV